MNPFRYRGYYQDSESGFYYLMSRYYNPVTHRFINADGYFQSGSDVLDTNMHAYCANNPIMYSDPTGEFVFAISLNGDATAGLGAYGAVTCAFDGNGNTAIQYTYIDYSKNGYVGVLDVGVGVTLSVLWDADSVYDLELDTTNVGASAGYIGSFGVDLIQLEDYSKFSGLSISGGVGIGVDVHEYTSTTKTSWASKPKSEQMTTNTTTPPKKLITKKYCQYCGKPIGTGPGKCSGGWQ